MVVVVIRYETTATARWALLFIVRAFFNDTITVVVWTGFHVRLTGMLSQLRDYIRRCFADPICGGVREWIRCEQFSKVKKRKQEHVWKSWKLPAMLKPTNSRLFFPGATIP
jgi:hypothetical protein